MDERRVGEMGRGRTEKRETGDDDDNNDGGEASRLGRVTDFNYLGKCRQAKTGVTPRDR